MHSLHININLTLCSRLDYDKHPRLCLAGQLFAGQNSSYPASNQQVVLLDRSSNWPLIDKPSRPYPSRVRETTYNDHNCNRANKSWCTYWTSPPFSGASLVLDSNSAVYLYEPALTRWRQADIRPRGSVRTYTCRRVSVEPLRWVRCSCRGRRGRSMSWLWSSEASNNRSAWSSRLSDQRDRESPKSGSGVHRSCLCV